jgi:uncharacterized protein YecE (DUF72 family)
MKSKGKKFLIGCSGYYYRTWKEKFYNNAPASQWLEEYSKVFNTVELNGTFYKVPVLKNLKKQAKQTPPGFKFSVKANRYVTHILRLKNSKKENETFENLMLKGLGNKLEKILFQMPPGFHYKEETLEAIEKNIADSELNAVEFRHISWWNETVFDFFKSRKIVFCNPDFPGLQPAFVASGNNFYLRLHGVPKLFASNYTEKRLKEIANQLPGDCKTYCIYFNNDAKGHAYENAQSLKKIIDPKFAK